VNRAGADAGVAIGHSHATFHSLPKAPYSVRKAEHVYNVSNGFSGRELNPSLQNSSHLIIYTKAAQVILHDENKHMPLDLIRSKQTEATYTMATYH